MTFHLIAGPQDICKAPECKWCDVMKKRFDYTETQTNDSSGTSTFRLDVNAPEFVPSESHCIDKLEDAGPVLIYSTASLANDKDQAKPKRQSGQPSDPDTIRAPTAWAARNTRNNCQQIDPDSDLYTQETEAARRLKGCELACLAFADTLTETMPMMLEEARRIVVRANKRKLQDYEQKILFMCQQSEEEVIRLVRQLIPPLGNYYEREREVTIARLNRITSLIEMQKVQAIALGADPEKREEQRLLHSAMEQTSFMLDRFEGQLQWLDHRTRELVSLISQLRGSGLLEFRAV